MEKYNYNLKQAIKKIEKLPSYKLDSDIDVLREAFDIAYNHELFSLYKYDKSTQEKLKLKLFSSLTPYSGSLSFLGIQILAANAIMNKNNFKKKDKYFNKKCGIAINHLRAKDTHVSAVKCKNGYKLSGILTWASGYEIFDTLLVGFHFDGKEFEVMAKFRETKGFAIKDTPNTFVGQSLNTVNIELDNFFVKEKNIVSSNSIGNYTLNKSLSKTIHYSLYGLGLGAVKHIEDKDFQELSAKLLKEEKEKFLLSENGTELDKLRIDLFKLIQNIITTSMINHGGKAILLERHLQRYYRELIMFNSNGLNNKIKELFKDEFLSMQV